MADRLSLGLYMMSLKSATSLKRNLFRRSDASKDDWYFGAIVTSLTNDIRSPAGYHSHDADTFRSQALRVVFNSINPISPPLRQKFFILLNFALKLFSSKPIFDYVKMIPLDATFGYCLVFLTNPSAFFKIS